MSEQEARLQRVTDTAEDVWDDPADAREWLNKTHPELDYRTPLEAAESRLEPVE